MDILWIGTTPHPVFNSHLSGLWTIFRIPGIPIPKPWFVTGMHPGSRVVYPDSIGCNLSQGFQVWCSLPIYMWLILYGFHVGILNIIYIPYTHGFLSMGYDAMSVSKGFPWWRSRVLQEDKSPTATPPRRVGFASCGGHGKSPPEGLVGKAYPYAPWDDGRFTYIKTI